VADYALEQLLGHSVSHVPIQLLDLMASYSSASFIALIHPA
jgi:hypothetical protein